MESNEVSSQEKLDRMFSEGKITREDYERLRDSLEGRRQETVFNDRPGIYSRVPWQIWVVVILLGLEGIGNLFQIPRMPIAAFWLAAKCLMIVGLIKGWRSVYVFTLVIVAIHVLYFLFEVPIAALINLILGILLIFARRFYFPKSDEIGERS